MAVYIIQRQNEEVCLRRHPERDNIPERNYFLTLQSLLSGEKGIGFFKQKRGLQFSD